MALSVKDASNNTKVLPVYGTPYSAALVAFAPAITTATTDCQLVVFGGAAAVVARIKRVRVLPRLTTLAFTRLRLERWSSAGTLGSAALTAFPTQARHGSPNSPGSQPSAPSATCKSVGTAAYTTPGTTSGIFRQENVIAKSTTAVDSPNNVVEWSFMEDPIEVVGTGDLVVLISYPLATATGAVFDIAYEWDEATV